MDIEKIVKWRSYATFYRLVLKIFYNLKVSIIANGTRNVRCVLVGLMNQQLKVLLKELIFTNLYAVHLNVSLNKFYYKYQIFLVLHT